MVVDEVCEVEQASAFEVHLVQIEVHFKVAKHIQIASVAHHSAALAPEHLPVLLNKIVHVLLPVTDAGNLAWGEGEAIHIFLLHGKVTGIVYGVTEGSDAPRRAHLRSSSAS